MPGTEFLKFVKELGWDLMVLAGDIVTIIGIVVALCIKKSDIWTVESLDNCTIYLGAGGLLSWISFLRYFNCHHKFNLLFNTLWAAKFDVFAYLLCIAVFMGAYIIFGLLVFGPYNTKFETLSTSAQTMFSLINGDEIFATFSNFRDDRTGSAGVSQVFQAFLYSYVAIFTVLALNILIALFTSAYEEVKRKYEEEKRTNNPLKAAIMELSETESFLQAVREMLIDRKNCICELENCDLRLKDELLEYVEVDEATRKLMPKKQKPRTLRDVYDDSESKIKFNMGCCCCRKQN